MLKDPQTITQTIETMVRRLVDRFDPDQIILFGSHARGTAGPDSDVDLLVVMPEGTHRGDTMGYLYQTVRGVGLPFDVMVATPQDLEKYGDRPGLVYRTALREGREVYAA